MNEFCVRGGQHGWAGWTDRRDACAARPRVLRVIAFTCKWLLAGILAYLAMVGVVTLINATLPDGGRWTLAAFKEAMTPDEPMQKLVKLLWEEGKALIQYLSYFLLAIALLIAVSRMRMVAKIISDFIIARGPIYNLHSTILETTKAVDKLAQLEPTIQLLNEKIDAAQTQLAELQRYTASERTDPGSNGSVALAPDAATTGAPAAAYPTIDDTANWERLRALWYANTRRLEAVIAAIGDGRRKNRYQRMPRTNYGDIIKALGHDGLINAAAEKASLDLNTTFNSYALSTNLRRISLV